MILSGNLEALPELERLIDSGTERGSLSTVAPPIRNSPRSSIGEAVRRSCHTNVTATTGAT